MFVAAFTFFAFVLSLVAILAALFLFFACVAVHNDLKKLQASQKLLAKNFLELVNQHQREKSEAQKLIHQLSQTITEISEDIEQAFEVISEDETIQ
jgi:uncharacterized protein HemX